MIRTTFILLSLLFSLTAFALGDRPYSTSYDPKRDAFADFNSAIQDASEEGKLVLIELGGDWCSWCHRLDKFFNTNKDIATKLDEVFVVLKVNVSDDNMNDEFVATLPKIIGYPHFVIANAEGEIIGSQNTGLLEEGQGYSKEAFTKFLTEWEGKKASK